MEYFVLSAQIGHFLEHVLRFLFANYVAGEVELLKGHAGDVQVVHFLHVLDGLDALLDLILIDGVRSGVH